MPRKSKKQIEAEAIIEQAEADAARAKSVVSAAYKRRYAERALNARKPKEVSRRAAARSCGDWLAMEIAKRCLDEKNKLKVGEFEALLDANGVRHDHWNRVTPGWQGRLRMTGRLALQRIVAEADGELALPDGSTVKAPRTWVEKHVH
jgi:hypothetical protein